jgi:hypothetical protein
VADDVKLAAAKLRGCGEISSAGFFFCCQKLVICERLNLKWAIRLRDAAGPRIEKEGIIREGGVLAIRSRASYLVISELSLRP